MKRLITIFVSSVISLTLFSQWTNGQGVPMTVLGNVYVNDNGVMKSIGPVHLKVDSAGSFAKVDNHGKFDVSGDTIIFYSNETIDGLLRNQAISTKDSVRAKGAAVRKVFPKHYWWYEMAFPFDVDLQSGVVNPLTGKPLVYYTDYYIQYYDAQSRADRGVNDEVNWVSLPAYSSLTSEQQVLHKGIGYRVAVRFNKLTPETFVAGSGHGDATVNTDTVGGYLGRFSVDFYAKNQTDIDTLFNRQLKGINLTFKRSPVGFFTTDNSEGWNAIGSLNSTNYFANKNTIDYMEGDSPGVIYYKLNGFYDPTNAYSTLWSQLNPEDETGTIRPYALFFVKTTALTDTVFKRAANPPGGFAYLGNSAATGLSLDAMNPVFRSSSILSHDLLKLQLTNVKDNTYTTKTYFRINNSYSKTFKSSEGDAIVVNTQSTVVPILWSSVLNDNNAANQTFINCLPSGYNEITLGVNIPTAGDYVFSLKEITNETVKSAILWDKTTNTQTELLNNSEYTFKVSAATYTEDRFVLFLNNSEKSITSIDQVAPDEIYAYVDNNILTVKNLNLGDKVRVLDLTGRIIASGIAAGNTWSKTLNQKGVYIVNVSSGKNLKVLNK